MKIFIEPYYSKIDFKVRYILVKDFFKLNKLQKVYNMEEDIQNYSQTVMFRGTFDKFFSDFYN